jgi:hypothetical protein
MSGIRSRVTDRVLERPLIKEKLLHNIASATRHAHFILERFVMLPDKDFLAEIFSAVNN